MIKIKPHELNEEFIFRQSHTLIILCTDSIRANKQLKELDFQNIDINIGLSQELLKYGVDERPLMVEKELALLMKSDKPLFVTNFTMLFDPRYEIDVIKFFCDKARFINIAIKWPGQYENDKLLYAKQECQDYHEYICNSYPICIVQ